MNKGLERVPRPKKDIVEWEAGQVRYDKSCPSSMEKKEKSMEATQILKASFGASAMMGDMIAKAENAEKAYLGKLDITPEGKMEGFTGSGAMPKGSKPGDVIGEEKAKELAGEGPKAAERKLKAPPLPSARTIGPPAIPPKVVAPGTGGAGSSMPGEAFTSAKPVKLVKPKTESIRPEKPEGPTKKAIEMLKAKKEESSPANPDQEQWSVSGFNMGGRARAATGCHDEFGGEHHGGQGPAQESVGGFPHAGSGPAQTSFGGVVHGGQGPAQTSVSGQANPGREGALNKAVTAQSMPRMPRAMAMAMDTWRSATRVLSRNNIESHVGEGHLKGELLEQSNYNAQQYGAQPPVDILKACGACGRSYTFRKGITEECPTCSINKSNYCSRCNEHLVKSSGGAKFCPQCG